MAPYDPRYASPLNQNPHPIRERHVVLVAPEVHWNTGNIGRTCLGAGARLHLIRPLGFSLNDRQIRRAGLDYWSRVAPQVWDNFDQFERHLQPAAAEIALLTKAGQHLFWQLPSMPRLFMVFGSETLGLPATLLERFADHTYRIPITGDIRCLNLSTAVGIVLFESLRPDSPSPSV
jgi:tRNA (cytidine/uridine-2'-O-)-methyltransferase